jgi:CheY-like chemotaxis protein
MVPKAAATQRILVVEDVQETRDAIEALLTSDGYSVDAVRSAEDAGERVRWRRPDLILISLGGAAGDLISTGERIRESSELAQDVPIIIFSITTIPEGTEQELARNIHVTRPDNFNQLRGLLRRVLQRASRKH